MNKPPACPECEKLSAVSNESNKIGDFLDWLHGLGLTICRYDGGIEMWLPHDLDVDPNRLLAKYYKIDLDKVEQERRALLDWIRSQNDS